MSLNDPYLLTPGPLTTSLSVKEAMLHDWGSWDADFNTITAEIRDYLLTVANAKGSHQCIPLQGSGTYAVEAAIATCLPRDGKLLILMNGAYGQRIAKICDYLEREYVSIDMGDYLPPDPGAVRERLQQDPTITHVALVHCETSSGILNPLEAIAKVVEEESRGFFIDSMSAFGALPLDSQHIRYEAMVSSANKCLEGVPGFGFAIIRDDVLARAKGNAHSLSLDLLAQWEYMEKTSQWRFTPPTHTVAAFSQAIKEYKAEGGREGRLARYERNRDRMVSGMRDIGFKTLLDSQWLSPIIVTFLSPEHPNFEFRRFYDALKAQGFVIYPGKLTEVDSFRVGCIGQLFDEQIDALLEAVKSALSELSIELN